MDNGCWTIAILMAHKTQAVGLMTSEKQMFEVFPIISLWELYIAMTTIGVSIQSALFTMEFYKGIIGK